ncbi:MAG: glycosyltransferase [Pseudomonadota bacterium]
MAALQPEDTATLAEPVLVQAAVTRAPGGIEAAMRHYHRMATALGLSTLALYRGPASAALAGDGIAPLPMPGPVARGWPGPGLWAPGLARRVAARVGGRRVLAVVHSDLALPAVRRLLAPAAGAVIAAPCHSDKADRKRDADLAITLNPAQHATVSRVLAGSGCTAALLGNPYVGRARPVPVPVPLPVPVPPAGRPRRFVFAARFTPVKAPLDAIRAHAALSDPPPLVMIGDGPERAAAEAAAGPGVTFAGWLADPWGEIGPADVLLLPSSWEGLPYLLLEALERGVPVIASDIGGNRAALGDGAYGALYPAGDTAALAAAMAAAAGEIGPLAARAQAGGAALADRYGATAFWQRLLAAAEATGRWARAGGAAA